MRDLIDYTSNQALAVEPKQIEDSIKTSLSRIKLIYNQMGIKLKTPDNRVNKIQHSVHNAFHQKLLDMQRNKKPQEMRILKNTQPCGITRKVKRTIPNSEER